MSRWADFYRTRDADRYLRYARTRYAPFLAIVQAAIRPGDTVIELGCGMGTITRALYDNGAPAKQFVMVDADNAMLGMAAYNSRYFHEDKIRLYANDARRIGLPDTDTMHRGAYDVAHSHGVLEHFSDEDIRAVVASQKRLGVWAAVHYVPGEKYDSPSFGDERLMTPEQWRDICDPHAIVPFNDGFDYALVWTYGTRIRYEA